MNLIEVGLNKFIKTVKYVKKHRTKEGECNWGIYAELTL